MSGEELLQGREREKAVVTHYNAKVPHDSVFVGKEDGAYVFVWRVSPGRIGGTKAVPDKFFSAKLNGHLEVEYMSQRDGVWASEAVNRELYRQYDALLKQQGITN